MRCLFWITSLLVLASAMSAHADQTPLRAANGQHLLRPTAYDQDDYDRHDYHARYAQEDSSTPPMPSEMNQFDPGELIPPDPVDEPVLQEAATEVSDASKAAKLQHIPSPDATEPAPLQLTAPEPTEDPATPLSSLSVDGCGTSGCGTSGCGTSGCGTSGCGTSGCGTSPRCPTSGCRNGCQGRSCLNDSLFGCGGPTGKPWQLPRPRAFDRLGIVWGGWVQQGVTFNSHNPADRFNGPVATNDRHAELQMNQAWLYLMRPTNTNGQGIDIGGRLDLAYGNDFRFGINYGLEDQINSVDNTYGLVIPQAYVEVAINRLKVKLGHFAPTMGYESVATVLSPLYSHSYTYGYTVPQLVTGVEGDYQLTDTVSLQAGFNRGWFMWEDVNDDLDLMAGAKWAKPDNTSSLGFAFTSGAQDPAGQHNRFVYSLVAQQQLTQKLRYVLVHNLMHEEGTNPRTGGDAELYSLVNYLHYQVCPAWTVGGRFEWLRDADGARIFGIPNIIPPVRTWAGAPGFEGDFFAATLGVTWRPHPNVMLRPEVRWDWYEGTRNLTGDLPFNQGGSSSQFLVGTDLVVTF